MPTTLTPIWALLTEWRLDALGAVFAIPVLVLVVVTGGYALPYLRQERYREESATRFWICFVLFGAGMLATVAAWDLLQFVVAWEVMTLASYVLVAHETSERGAVRAAFKYFVMTHAASACLLLAVMLLWAEGGTLGFDGLRGVLAAMAEERPVLLHVVLALLFVAFATKAGLYPLGDWLPDAHPAAPAPVSAVLSGIMVKVGLYGFLRFFVWGLAAASPAIAAAWGYPLAAAGAVSALLGGLAACAAQDIKVMLAYSSIAQSGLIALGIGAALVLAPQAPVLAQLALLGALFHTVGDAVVKALLFLAAGSLQYRTGSRRLEDMGGLFRAMPVTAWTALLASLSIAGFPPLTAFVGKWLMLQGSVLSGSPSLVGAGIVLLVASVLSILYALKFFSAAFLAGPARPGRLEVPAAMAGAQVVLAGLTLALGLAPGLWLGLLAPALAGPSLPGVEVPVGWAVLGFGPASGAYVPLLLVVAGAWTSALAVLAVGRARARRSVRTWMGGAEAGADPAPLHAAGFFVPMREAMGGSYSRLRFRAVVLPGWVPSAVNADRWFYRPAVRAFRGMGEALQRAHTGTAHRYIVWQLIGALVLITLLFVERP
jgi:hydrogenase-4 component B